MNKQSDTQSTFENKPGTVTTVIRRGAAPDHIKLRRREGVKKVFAAFVGAGSVLLISQCLPSGQGQADAAAVSSPEQPEAAAAPVIPVNTAYVPLAYGDRYGAQLAVSVVLPACPNMPVMDQNGERVQTLASLTKIRTLELVAQAIEDGKLSLTSELVVSAEAIRSARTTAGGLARYKTLQPGDTITTRRAAQALGAKSEGTAAFILAENVATAYGWGGAHATYSQKLAAFVDHMNGGVRFADPAGDYGNEGSVRDMIHVAHSFQSVNRSLAEEFLGNSTIYVGGLTDENNNVASSVFLRTHPDQTVMAKTGFLSNGVYEGTGGLRVNFGHSYNEIVTVRLDDGSRATIGVLGAPSKGARSHIVADIFERVRTLNGQDFCHGPAQALRITAAPNPRSRVSG